MDDLIIRAAEDISAARCVTALTGAGVSIESGIPPFRGKGGLWEKIDPMEYAHIDAFRRDPKKVWEVLIKGMKDILDSAKPNDAHIGLARLEKLGKLTTIITQNVDGLHQAAGNTDVIEFHGNFAWQCCADCGKQCKSSDLDMEMIPPRCQCGGIFRPNCIFFGEMIPPDAMRRSQTIATSCDVMLVMGTSAMVQPAAHMPVLARENGAKVIEINPEPTPLTGFISDYIIQGSSGHVMNEIMARLEGLC
jgi:NAD-dependent deacetylase